MTPMSNKVNKFIKHVSLVLFTSLFNQVFHYNLNLVDASFTQYIINKKDQHLTEL